MKKLLKTISVVLIMTLVLTSGITVAFADSWKKPGKLTVNNRNNTLKVEQVQEQLRQRKNEREKEIQKYMDKVKEKLQEKSKVSKEKELKELEGKIKQLEKEVRELHNEIEKLKKDRGGILQSGNAKKDKAPAVIKCGRFLIPTRPIIKASGAELEWDEKNKTLTIEKDKTTITINLDNGEIKVNGDKLDLSKYGWANNNGRCVPISLITRILRDKYEIDKDEKDDHDEDEDEDEDEDYDGKIEKIISVNDNVTGTANGQFQYIGDWKYAAQTGAFMNDNHWSNSTDDFFRVKFTGNQIKLYGAKDPSHGIAAVSIDDGDEVIVDYYAAERSDNVLIYTSPILKDGEHTLKVRVTGAKNKSASDKHITVDKVEIVELVEPEGVLEGVIAKAPDSVNLSNEGKVDWVHWGNTGVTGYNRKVTTKSKPDITNYTQIGTGTLSWVSNNPVKFSWNGGTPTSQAANIASAIYMSNVSSGFQFAVPADTNEKTLRVYVAAWDATGKLEAVLSDGSAAPYTVDIVSDSGIACKVVTIRYKAKSEGEKLTVRYTVKSFKGNNISNISLQAATLK